MQLGKLKDASLFIKLLIWVGLIMAGGVVFFLISTVFFVTGVDMSNASVMRGILVFQDVFLFICPAVLAACFWSTKPAQWLKVNTKVNWKIIIGAIILIAVALPGNNLLSKLNQQISLPESLASIEQWMQMQEDAAEQAVMYLFADTNVFTFIANFIVIAILAAIGEEFCFRGVLQGLMKHTTAAIWITAIIFSTIHLQFYGFFPRLLMGALFGYMLVWSNNIWVPIAMHCTNNGIIAILYYIANTKGIDTQKMDDFGTGDTLWIGIASLVLVLVGVYIFRRSLTINRASSRTSKGN